MDTSVNVPAASPNPASTSTPTSKFNPNGKRRKLNSRMKFNNNRFTNYQNNANNNYQNHNFFPSGPMMMPPPGPLGPPGPNFHNYNPHHNIPPQPNMQNPYQQQKPNSMPFSFPIFVLDHHCLRHHLPIINPNYNEQICHQKLLKRHESLMLERNDLVQIQSMLTNSRRLLENIVDSNGRKLFIQLEDIGSFPKNVFINVRPYVVDLVALMRIIPAESDIESICEQFNKFIMTTETSETSEPESGNKDNNNNNLKMEITDLKKAILKITLTDKPGFAVKVLIGVIHKNLFQHHRKSNPNRNSDVGGKQKITSMSSDDEKPEALAAVPAGPGSGDSVDVKSTSVVSEDVEMEDKTTKQETNIDPLISSNILQCRNFAINHVQWLRMNGDETTLILVRLLKDICSRFDGFRTGLNPWMLEVFAKYCCTTPNGGGGNGPFHYQGNQHHKIELKDAFFRAFQLLSAGIFLSDSVSIKDPVSYIDRPIHLETSPKQLDLLCCTAQTLLRILNFDKGFEIIIGLEPDLENIAENLTVWDGVYVTPSITVCVDDEDEDIGGDGGGGGLDDEAFLKHISERRRNQKSQGDNNNKVMDQNDEDEENLEDIS